MSYQFNSKQLQEQSRHESPTMFIIFTLNEERMKVILVGGFLGSGKTTAIVNACQQLIKQGKKVGVVTNDQGNQQVDYAFVKHFGIPTREVSNGCFCCNYGQLDAHLASLVESDQPDFIFAESVGSCTDLVATIARPLNKFKPEIDVSISIFADADLICALIEGRSSFLEESVRYIYKKQLEEADILIINKTDLMSPSQLITVQDVIRSEYEGKIILYQNSWNDSDISTWLHRIDQFDKSQQRLSLNIDYNVYGEGESKLAWLDKSLTIHASFGNAVEVAYRIIGSLFDRIQQERYTIGHLKFFLETEGWSDKISFTTTSTSGDLRTAPLTVKDVAVLINARVQTEPNTMVKILDEICITAEQSYDCKIHHKKVSAFKPGFPKPTHRIINDP